MILWCMMRLKRCIIHSKTKCVLYLIFCPKCLIFIHCHCLSVPCFMYFMTALYICIKKHFKTRVKTERKEMKMIYFPSSADLWWEVSFWDGQRNRLLKTQEKIIISIFYLNHLKPMRNDEKTPDHLQPHCIFSFMELYGEFQFIT